MILILIGIIVGLVSWSIYSEFMYRHNLNMLLNRVMSKSYVEYVSVGSKIKLSEPKSMSDRAEYEQYCKSHGITPEQEEA